MALGPGPAGLKFWTPQGITADNTADIGSLPASVGDQFNPWGPKRPLQDWVLGSSPLFAPVGAPFTLTGDAGSYAITGSDAGLTVNDPVNLPAGMTGHYVPWGRPFPVTLLTRTGGVLIAAEPVILTAAGGSYAITGTPNILAFGQGAAAGAYALTGSSAALALGHMAGSGSYTLTGSNAALALGLGAGAGSYTITGTAAGLTIPGSLLAAAGSYTITGTSASLTVASPSDTTNLPAGAVNWFNPWGRRFPINLRTSTGRPLAEVVAPVTLTAAGGSYAITGSSATLALGLTVNAGSYALSGAAAALATGFAAGVGSYAITGTDAQFALVGNIILACGAGSYTITGSSITISPPEALAGVGGGGGRRYPRFRKKKDWRDELEDLLADLLPPEKGEPAKPIPSYDPRPLEPRLPAAARQVEDLLKYIKDDALPSPELIIGPELLGRDALLSTTAALASLSRISLPQIIPEFDEDDDEEAVALLLAVLFE